MAKYLDPKADIADLTGLTADEIARLGERTALSPLTRRLRAVKQSQIVKLEMKGTSP